MNDTPPAAAIASTGPSARADADPDALPLGQRIRRRAAAFWLNYFFWHTRYIPWVARWTKWFYLSLAWRYSRVLPRVTLANARHILGPQATDAQRTRLAKHTIGSFYDFVYDVGRSRGMSVPRILRQVEAIEGHPTYERVRALHRGAIVVTAHMGSFEVGVAALRQHESRVHVVFQRDTMDRFEQLRGELRRRLGVIEAPLEQGWDMWLRLREALKADEVVLLQGDRVLPGQRGQRVPFFDGHIMLPTGPMKLALATGAPLLPVFTIRRRHGKIRLFIEEPIFVEQNCPRGQTHPALLQLAGVLERYVRAYPHQWLILRPAWCEDAPSDS